ncbi:hypothetical protein BDK51DRAFT_43753 [Blyttiomyces helicus]|uniref:Uncharacterized protein n=1 Tax=Blyttiomyces helicus TaxID=388810 RepID=A0A4P9WH10_9FUNG|nr:hypothetical protein BDK51DRAFT_43753 [Blyttiomyces helicus]|eukprot:RKO90340.1 hypothetical protein BDK51DRAFT_43753 [Blyttiomyces helicus]
MLILNVDRVLMDFGTAENPPDPGLINLHAFMTVFKRRLRRENLWKARDSERTATHETLSPHSKAEFALEEDKRTSGLDAKASNQTNRTSNKTLLRGFMTFPHVCLILKGGEVATPTLTDRARLNASWKPGFALCLSPA